MMTEPHRKLFLKFEYDGQLYELSSLTFADTVGDLRAVICSMLNIDDFRKINLKTLQPTRLIDTSDDSKPLSAILHQPRERIVVQEVLAPPSLQPAATSSTTRSHSAIDNHADANSTNLKQSSSRIPSKSGIKHHKADVNNLSSSSSNNTREQSPPFRQTVKDFSDSFEDPLGHTSNKLQEHQSNFNVPTAPSLTSSNESPIRQRKLPRDQSTDYPVCSSTGYLLRHPVPSNNSCLFISVHFCLTNGVVDDQIGKSMRKIIADTVASDKQHFDDAFLGKSNADYCRWILDDNNWGGAIELSILCKYYKTEIVAIDVKNTILNRFGEDSHYPQRMLLLYDGLHYDPLKFQPLDDNQPIQTMFSTENIEVLSLAEELAKEAKQSHQFTDMKTITMRCASCNAELDAKSAPEHAAKTGHVDFIEK